MDKLTKGITVINGIKVVNTTPHLITMTDKNLSFIANVDPCGVLINAKPVATPVVSNIPGVAFQRTGFQADADTLDMLSAFKAVHPDVVVIGSMVAAQAYPGLVVAMVPHPDFVRVHPQDKKMLIDSYIVY